MAWIINAKAAQNLRNYKYVGSDNSLLYKYLLSPFAQYCVDTFVPSWMAPNVITLMGLLIEVFTLCVVMFYCPQFAGDENTPRWIYLLIAASLLTYQTLDNMDGKQARKTGSSSPLGLIFDHGCDAVNAGVGALLSCTLFAIPAADTAAVLLACSLTSVPFYWATWEEYHLHALVLPWVNGPSEGVFGGALCSVLTFFVGPTWWHQTIYGVPLYLVPQLACVFGWIVTIAVQTANVCRHVAKGARNKLGAIHPALSDLLPFVYLVYLGCAWLRDTPDLMARCPHLALALLFLLTAEAEIALMVAHCSGTRFTCWRPVLTPLAALWANTGIFKSPPVDPFYALLAYFIAASIYFAFFVSRVVIEVKDALGIHAFSIKPRLPKTKQGAPLEEKAKAD